jgi:hypothetical protein
MCRCTMPEAGGGHQIKIPIQTGLFPGVHLEGVLPKSPY